MTLIKSISGIRGTIGGKVGENLTPQDVVKFTSAYAVLIKNKQTHIPKIIVGRDARISGNMINNIVVSTLCAMGIDVVDIGMATTPTVEIAVDKLEADGGIILTASHNPKHWNALKLLNNKGEFISATEGEELLNIVNSGNICYSEIDDIGSLSVNNSFAKIHIDSILNLTLVDVDAIKNRNFTVVIDAVNSVGGIIIPDLLRALGVSNIIELYCEPNGIFPHNPEPLPENLTEISEVVNKSKADIGFVVDPDVDRLAIVNEDGSMFGEEYTLVAVADYILKNKKGNTVSNMSSTQALRDVTLSYNCKYFASAVGEVNVVKKMKETNAIIGGEGNGGIIYPELHYGRDALVGIALFLSFLAKSDMKCSELRRQYPEYYISKNKIQLPGNIDVDSVLKKVKSYYENCEILTDDGLKIVLKNEWIHLRKSNTEPIIRIYSESTGIEKANKLAESVIEKINTILNKELKK